MSICFLTALRCEAKAKGIEWYISIGDVREFYEDICAASTVFLTIHNHMGLQVIQCYIALAHDSKTKENICAVTFQQIYEAKELTLPLF